jgi:Lipocalin-like domain
MKVLVCLTFVAVVALAGLFLHAHGSRTNDTTVGSAKEKFIGAWDLVSLDVPGPDGKMTRIADLKGMLLYTRDGHMSVQLMYPKSASDLTNDYVKSGYEASYGSYVVNEQAHTVTHHVEGSITEGLIGKDLPRAYQLSGGHLTITSTRSDEHWSVTWEHY